MLGSYLTAEMHTLFRITWLICKFEGEPRNDGLVGVELAHLPEALPVTEAGVDHAMAVIEVPGTGAFDPATCLTALADAGAGLAGSSRQMPARPTLRPPQT